LHEAVKQRDIQAVQRLLESGVSPNLKDASGNTPLYWAIVWAGGVLSTPRERVFGKLLLPLLLRHGADTTLTKGGSIDETYDQFARSLRVVDMLERARQRYSPRNR
jgi:hypothetical protein